MRLPIRLSPLLLPAVLASVLRTSPASAQAVGPEFRVNTYTTDRQGGPRIATDPGGNFVVVWQSNTQDGSSHGVFGQRYTSAGAPLGPEFRVNTYTTNTQVSPSMASDSGGNFVVVWQSYLQDGSRYGIFGQRYGSTGAPLGAEFRVNTFTTSYQRFPSVASDSGGNFVVVWQSNTQDGSDYGVFGQLYGSAGAPLGGEFQVNAYTPNTQSRPSVARDSGGNFVVVWHSRFQDGSLYGVFGQRYGSAGAPLGAEFRVNTYTTDDQRYPSVATDSGGNFVVVWRSSNQDGSSYGVFGQRYGSAGAPLAGEFLVNTYTMGAQASPSVASDSSGHFIVVWQSETQDGSYGGVFGQRFCPALTSVTISVSGTTTVCTTSTGGTATVTDDGGGNRTHQWGYRTTMGGSTSSIIGQTGTSYLINGANFPVPPNFYYLVCATFPECGTTTFSNEVLIAVNTDMTAPTVTPPSALTTTQTLCM